MIISFDQSNNGGEPPADTLLVPHTEADYQRLVAMLDELIDTVGEAEDHSHAGLMEILGALLESYEERHVPEPTYAATAPTPASATSSQ